jgi:hypothetical protein
MRNGKLSRRSVLEGSTAFAAPLLFPKLLKAAAPDPTTVSPALIEAAMKARVDATVSCRAYSDVADLDSSQQAGER